MDSFAGHLKVVVRKLRREKLYAFINLAGLSLAVACCLILALYLRSELTYDRHFEGHENIYRIVEEFENRGQLDAFARTGAPLGYLMKQDFDDVVDYVAFYQFPSILLRHEDQGYFWDRVYEVTPNVFDVFKHEIVYGDPQAWAERRGVAVSEAFARRYFGAENPVGKVITSDIREPRTIEVVFADLPENTHLKYDVLLPREQTTENMGSIFQQRQQLWSTPAYTYLVMREGFEPARFDVLAADFYDRHMAALGNLQGMSMRYWLEPLSDVHLFSDVQRDEPGGNLAHVYAFGAVAVFIVLIACINYTNLATAQAVGRAREVGMRKILGAHRGTLMMQFIAEALVLSAAATILGAALVEILLEYTPVNQLLGKPLQLDLIGEPAVTGWIALASVAIGLLAGAYPAIYLSSWAPLVTLVGGDATSGRNVYLRQGLVFVQFTVSIAVIAGTLLMAKQMRYLSDLELGFDEENRIVIDLVGADLIQDVPVIREELLGNPSVLAVAAHEQILGRLENMRAAGVENDSGIVEPMTINVSRVDEHFLDAMAISITTGRGFSAERADKSSAAIVNEALVKARGWSEPLGKQILDGSSQRVRRVIGVMEDVHFQSLHTVIDPLVYIPFDDAWDTVAPRQRAIMRRYLTVSIAGGSVRETLAWLEQRFAEFDPRYPFQFRFLDESLDELYRSEENLMKLIGAFAGVSVFIACLGLFGLASFTTAQRRRELSIRKVLGASSLEIVQLVAGNALVLILAGGLIGSFAAYLAVDGWLLGFAYRTDMGIASFALAILVALGVAYLTVALQSFRTAQADPADALRYE